MSTGVGALIAQVVFWAALLIGWFSGELSPRLAMVFAALWFAGYAASAHVPQGGYLFPSFVAMLDVVLVLVIVKADIHLT